MLLDVYNSFLWLPAIVGVVVFIYGLITLGIETDDERELCNANASEYTLGAACVTCLPIALPDNCGEYKAASGRKSPLATKNLLEDTDAVALCFY